MNKRALWLEAYRLMRMTKPRENPNVQWALNYPIDIGLLLGAAWCGRHGDRLRGGIHIRAGLHRAGIDRSWTLHGHLSSDKRKRLPA